MGVLSRYRFVLTNIIRWHGAVSVGIPRQTFLVTMDTGSPDFWLLSNQVPADKRGGAPLYDPSKSSSSSLLNGYTFSICYEGNVCLSGNVYTDIIQLGSLAVAGFPVEAAQVVAGKDNGVTSGVFGINLDPLEQAKPTKLGAWFPTVKPYLKGKVMQLPSYIRKSLTICSWCLHGRPPRGINRCL